MQDIDQKATEMALVKQKSTLQSGDQLVITVMATDIDVVKPFNQNYSSGQMLQGQISGNVPPTSTSLPTSSGPTYIVDENGDIDFPVLGKINTKGITLDEFKTVLNQKLTRYIKDPSLSVKLNNFKVSLMGEVARPGEYVMSDGKATLMSALGMAGDLTIYGNRNDVLLVRTVDGKMEKARIDLTRSDFIDSPYYQLKQGDVIYVSPNKTRQTASKFGPQTAIYISVASILVTILALVIKK